MRIGPRLVVVVVVAALLATLTTGHDEDQEGSHWRWPAEETTRLGAGRLIPDRRPPQQANLQPVTRRPLTRLTTTTAATPSPIEVTTTAATAKKNESSVPLLKDAGKPGNPYILLNDIMPPKNFIRTPAEEEANLNALQSKNLGGLDASEVWLADDDLFVVRGFNLKKPYNADPLVGGPISDYVAPAPNPPPAPEPGTVFYPSNKTEETLNNYFNNPNGGQPDFSSFPPYPFLPPPPPQWTEEKEFNNNDIRDPFQSLSGGPPGFALFNGSQGFPPSSGLPGSFPGGGPPQTGGGGGGPPINATIPDDDDEDVPFTPLFAERPVEFYFPTHDTVAKPPGPNGPGIFVPPPLKYFAPRDPNEVINVDIPQKLFRPPFNLPNYYQKTSSSSAQRLPANNRPGTVQSVPVASTVNQPVQQQQISHDKPCNHALPAQQPIVPLAFRPQQPQQQQKVTNNFYPGFHHSLLGDTDVNFKFPRPTVNPESELINPLPPHQLKPKLPPTAWNPYNIQHPADILQSWAAQHQQQQPLIYEDKKSNNGDPSAPPNFVSVYRTGSGSYSYNLGRR